MLRMGFPYETILGFTDQTVDAYLQVYEDLLTNKRDKTTQRKPPPITTVDAYNKFISSYR